MILKSVIIIFWSFIFLVPLKGQDLKKITNNFNQHINEIDSIQAHLFHQLKVIALNQKLKPKERREAFNLIGKLKSAESLEFIFDNIDLYLYKADFLGDDDEFKVYPCFYSIINKRDISDYWSLMPYILKTLEKDIKNEEAITLLSLLLMQTFHSDTNTLESFLKQKFKIAYDENYKKNLNQILLFLNN